jgi:serine/threonine protein kinase
MYADSISVQKRPQKVSPYKNGASGLKSGATLGNYKLGALIGSGNFGQVYYAEQLHLGGRRAVKVFDLAATPNEDIFKAFVHSARLLATLRHANIVMCHDFGVTDDRSAYLVMDLIEPGVALDLIPSRVSTDAAISMLAQMARALEHAHESTFVAEDGREHRGIYHGDIKPSNILAGHDRAYLSDFMLPNSDTFLRRNLRVQPLFPYYSSSAYGTPMYMAPEQLRDVVNASTDIFSFGVVAYELLTGCYPWDNGHEFEGYFRRPEYRPPVVPAAAADRNARVPGIVSALVAACIELHSGDRPPSMSEVAATLERETMRELPIKRQADIISSVRYDVALSFAGSDRAVAQQLYVRLKDHCKVFYDFDAEITATLWGDDLSTNLHKVYSQQARFCIALVSHEYVERAWTNWERRAILQRMVADGDEPYLLPVLIEDVPIPGLPSTVGTLRLAEHGIDGIVETFLRKLKRAEPAA